MFFYRDLENHRFFDFGCTVFAFVSFGALLRGLALFAFGGDAAGGNIIVTSLLILPPVLQPQLRKPQAKET